MLVISQKKGETIKIGRDITIHILDVKPGKVKIGIEAPASVSITRDNYKKKELEIVEIEVDEKKL